jgi:hypothetical protein
MAAGDTLIAVRQSKRMAMRFAFTRDLVEHRRTQAKETI